MPPRRRMPHYHGDAVRGLFVVAALLLIVAQSTGAVLPLSTSGAVISAILLVVFAGITNPAQSWIHYVDAFIEIVSVFTFGTAAIEHARAGVSFFNPSYLYGEALAIISLVALYLTIRTIRGNVQRPQLK